MSERMQFTIEETCELVRANHQFVVHCLRAHWVSPAFPAENAFDEADIARLRLIRELIDEFGVNEEAIPLILHLVDELHTLHELAGGLRAG